MTVVTLNRAADLTVANATGVYVPWDFVRDDLDGWFDPTDPTYLPIVEPGAFSLTFQGAWHDVSGGGNRFMHVERNPAVGDSEVLIGVSRAPTEVAATVSCAWSGRLFRGDRLRVVLFQNTGSSELWGGANRSPHTPIIDSRNCELGLVSFT